MATATQTVFIEIEADLTANTYQDDYGVQGSPVWTVIEEEEIDGPVTVAGKEYTRDQLKGMTAWDLLNQALCDAADPESWSGGDDDRDYGDD